MAYLDAGKACVRTPRAARLLCRCSSGGARYCANERKNAGQARRLDATFDGGDVQSGRRVAWVAWAAAGCVTARKRGSSMPRSP
ncbi:hypothetical protein XAC2852_140073 [Xanthomonas citri pv. citri]|uniref:Uncharacterized protein n=1 Tax=Xanthomonas citri pv. citri TaxID=611301 RepID=A0A0U5F9G7_XANCI|nr:hypothetical protein XAC3824_120266 [Xanthomonas citri pv. citri]CEE18339.1 hypothetical protein XAC1083_130073 [Xanthomonas citri pv. citri]CEE24436.1 hypothetical protein XAC2911_110271 [Xanthomonas citri pv. citri]CEE58048.1 hypothetical protein XAC2852_140073 [Xanthomonas citri pv. citri]CEE65849.1 hypothetical protein XACLC80_120083 [Xanthomonas citri pv. citri]